MTDIPSDAPFHDRFGQYLLERFHPARNGLAALILAAGLAFSYTGTVGYPAPLDLSLAATIVLVVGMFLILRICDELKDAEDDARHRPSRPVPRGLVSLGELRNVAIGVGVVQAFVLLVEAPGLWVLLVSTWGWVVLMTFEFGAGAWLKRRPVVYLLSHMMVMPFIAMLAMGVASGSLMVLIDPVAWFLAAIAFSCGIVMEIGRKVWDEEIEGVETYSRLWGRSGAAARWLIVVASTTVLVALFQWLFVSGLLASIAVMALGAAVIAITMRNARHPIRGAMIEVVSTIVVLAIQIVLAAGPWLP